MTSRHLRLATRKQHGIALIVVLWASALLSVVAASFVFAMRTEAGITINTVDRAKAKALAEAGIMRAIMGLTERERDLRWASDGRLYSLRLATGEIRISVQSEKGKIDINRAPSALIEGLLSSLENGAEMYGPGGSRGLSHALLDWRDRDDKVRPEGAERKDYEAAQMPFIPQNRAFLSVAELNQVIGMTDKVYQELKELVTVHSFSSRIDPATASRNVLLAVPGLDAAAVDAFLVARAEILAAESQQAPASGDANAAAKTQARGTTGRRGREPALPLNMLQAGRRYLSRAKSNVYTVTAEGRTPDGTRVVRKAIVRVTRSKRRPYVILAWGDGVLPSEAQTAAQDDDSAQYEETNS